MDIKEILMDSNLNNIDLNPFYHNLGSVYCKDDLPTWNEIYEWYRNKIFTYNMKNNNNEMEPYWQIPRKAYLIYMCANYLNMLVYQNFQNLIQNLNGKELDGIAYIRFVAEEYLEYDIQEVLNLNIQPVPIYTLMLPCGQKNFMNTDYQRIYIDKNKIPPLKFHMELIHKTEKGITVSKYYPGDYQPIGDSMISHMTLEWVLSVYLAPLIKYFEGDKVGWKDNENINTDPIHNCKSDIDPAL